MLSKPPRVVVVPGQPGRPAVPPDPGSPAYEYCYVPAPPPPPSGSCGLTLYCVTLPPDPEHGLGERQLCVYVTDPNCNPGGGGGGGPPVTGRPPGGPWPPWSGPHPDQVCVTVPARPPSPGTPEVPATPPSVHVETHLGWDSGANSVQVLEGDVEVRFTMERRVIGAVIGFAFDRDAVPEPSRIAYGFQFVFDPHPAGGVFVVEAGSRKTLIRACAPGVEYSIRRSGGEVRYYIADELVYASRVPAGSGPISVASSLYASGDALPAGGGDVPPSPPAPGDVVTEFEFVGSVPPTSRSPTYVLAAGNYRVEESADGASCDWVLYNENGQQIDSNVEGGAFNVNLSEDTSVYVEVAAFGGGGPFQINAYPSSGGGA